MSLLGDQDRTFLKRYSYQKRAYVYRRFLCMDLFRQLQIDMCRSDLSELNREVAYSCDCGF